MEEQLLEKNVKFIIVDSIASLIRKEFDSSNLAQRQHMLTKQASLLKYYAESLQIPVVVTNQVTARTDNLLAGMLTQTLPDPVMC
jgi:RAD51-like protein 1